MGSDGPPLLRDLFSSSLAMVLATCVLGGSGVGYLTVLAIDASLEGGWALGVAMVYSCGLALRDLDFSRVRVGGGGGGGGCDPEDPTTTASSIGFLSLSFMC